MTKPELNTAVDQFVAKHNEKKVDYDSMYGAQCFDLFQFYNRDVIGGSFVTGNGAKDIWDTYPKNLYDRIPNTPEGVPQKGDVMIWGSGYGIYGHVAIVLEADVTKFKALSQNDPVGRETYIRTYDYYQTLGWLSPKVTAVVPNNDVKKAVQFDQTLTFLKSKGYITDDNSTHYLDGQFLGLIQRLWSEKVGLTDKLNQSQTKIATLESQLLTQKTDLLTKIKQFLEKV